jgi:hypothetical protein
VDHFSDSHFVAVFAALFALGACARGRTPEAPRAWRLAAGRVAVIDVVTDLSTSEAGETRVRLAHGTEALTLPIGDEPMLRVRREAVATSRAQSEPIYLEYGVATGQVTEVLASHPAYYAQDVAPCTLPACAPGDLLVALAPSAMAYVLRKGNLHFDALSATLARSRAEHSPLVVFWRSQKDGTAEMVEARPAP